MTWQQVRQHFPETWLLIEAVEAHSQASKRYLDQIAVVEPFDDSGRAMTRYVQLHHESPDREYYVIHTSREEPDIEERHWIGIRG